MSKVNCISHKLLAISSPLCKRCYNVYSNLRVGGNLTHKVAPPRHTYPCPAKQPAQWDNAFGTSHLKLKNSVSFAHIGSKEAIPLCCLGFGFNSKPTISTPGVPNSQILTLKFCQYSSKVTTSLRLFPHCVLSTARHHLSYAVAYTISGSVCSYNFQITTVAVSSSASLLVSLQQSWWCFRWCRNFCQTFAC